MNSPSLRIRLYVLRKGLQYPFIPILFGRDWNPNNPIRSGRGLDSEGVSTAYPRFRKTNQQYQPQISEPRVSQPYSAKGPLNKSLNFIQLPTDCATPSSPTRSVVNFQVQNAVLAYAKREKTMHTEELKKH